MRLGIKGKQVLGVTSIVGAVVVLLSLMYLAGWRASASKRAARAPSWSPTRSSTARARCVHGARRRPGAAYQALRDDPGLRSILESSLYSKNVTFAAIVDVNERRRRARRSRARRRGAAGGRRSRRAGRAGRRSRSCGDLLRAGAEPRVQAAAAARRHRVRIDPDRRLDAARPAGSGRVARPGDRDGRRRRSPWRSSARCCWRSCCCGRFTSSAAA